MFASVEIAVEPMPAADRSPSERAALGQAPAH
jgi:hypothetical protein